MSLVVNLVAADGATSTVPVPDPVVSGASPSPGLFFQLPDVSASTKKILSHYFIFPIAIDTNGNTGPNDYYATQYIAPNGEGGSHAAYGGYIRNRPMPRSPIPSGAWDVADSKTSILHAKSVGIDGFFVDMLAINSSGYYSEAMFNDLITAAASFPGFIVAGMVDCSGVPAIADTVNALKTFWGKPSTWMDNGSMIVGSFMAEGCPASWWAQLVTAMHNAGMPVKFVQTYLNAGLWQQNSAENQWAAGQWGPGADPAVSGSVSPNPTSVRAAGQKVLAPVWVADQRPYASVFTESLNTQNLTVSWMAAINNNVDIVQMTTWSDYSEGGEFANSASKGMAACDISAYFIAWLKTGKAPVILKDAIYLSYRGHTAGATRLGPQTKLMSQRVLGSPLTYNVEALVFLTAPATVNITVAGVNHAFSAPAGMSRFTTPAVAGSASSTVVRNGVTTASVAPPVTIRSKTWVDDYQYYFFGSVRTDPADGAALQYQFDCTPTNSGGIPTYPTPGPG